MSVYCWHVARFATPIHSLSSLVESHVLPCTCKYVRARVPGSRFFSSHPLARDPPREGTFSNRWWPTAAQFFFLFLASSTPSTLFFFFLHSLSLSLSFLQVHPLSPIPLSHRCPIHPPQTGVATCSELFHLIRGHKLLPRSLYTATEKKRNKRAKERERERERENEGGKTGRSFSFAFRKLLCFVLFFLCLFLLNPNCSLSLSLALSFTLSVSTFVGFSQPGLYTA